MDKEVLNHVYFMPGMAANHKIFENISLDEKKFKMHFLEWEIPLKNESLKAYAKRISLKITHPHPVLIGVSFGGILVQEIAKLIPVKKVIIISSVKSKYELPKRMRLAALTGANHLLPTSLVNNVELLAKYAFGDNVTKRLALYEKYLSVRDKYYLDWAIDKVVNWGQKKPAPGLIHIHGEKDPVFPIRYIKDCIQIKGGTHIMIINKFRWFNENLSKLILED